MWTDGICQEDGTFACRKEKVKMATIPKVKREELGENPFVHDLVIEATKITDKGKYAPDEEGVMIPAVSLIERQKYVRVYRVAGGKERAMNLSAVATKMLVYIMYSIEGSSEYLIMTPEQYKKSTGSTSRNTYTKGVAELWRYGYIQPAVQKYVYWVNPTMLFGGNRINKWTEKVIVKTSM